MTPSRITWAIGQLLIAPILIGALTTMVLCVSAVVGM